MLYLIRGNVRFQQRQLDSAEADYHDAITRSSMLLDVRPTPTYVEPLNNIAMIPSGAEGIHGRPR